MDKKGIIAVVICVLLLGWWFIEQNKTEQHRLQLQAQFDATNKVSQAEAKIAAANSAIANPVSASTATVTPFDIDAPEQTLVLTNGRARYTFTSRGGGLKKIELLKYPETISLRWQKNNHGATNGLATLNQDAFVPVLAILGDTNLVGDGNFNLTQTATGVRAQKAFAGGLVITKDFSFGSNYLVNASVSLQNSSDKPLALPSQQWIVGTATPMDLDDNEAYVNSLWSDGTNYTPTALNYFNTNTSSLFGIIPRTPTPTFTAGNGDVFWAAAENQFFAVIAMTQNGQPAQQVFAEAITLPPLSGLPLNLNQPAPRGIQTALVYPAQILPANSVATRQIILYAGPKEFRTLSLIGEQFHNRADLAMNFGTGYVSFWGIGSFFAKLLLSAMNWLHDVTTLGYGWVIVLLTLLLRGIFWPLTAISLRSSKKMQALAPEIKALKEKYKDDAQKFTQKQMELWKKNKVNPMSGCLPMLVQTPVFIGFYTMIRCAIELRGAHWLWIADLTKPDTLFMIPGTDFPFNLLPLLMVGTMILQAHLQPPSPGMDESQQKMMRYMPLMFLLFFYNYSSGMALYITVSTLASAIQTKLTRAALAAESTPVLTRLPKNKK
jgi:YidC/Oxa1 family membrane protein insertase